MVPEKLSWFKKHLANLGKRLFYRRSDKISLLLTSLVVQATIEEYQSVLDGSLPKALKVLGDAARGEAADLMTDLLENPIIGGFKMAMLLSKDISEVPMRLDWALYSLAGKNTWKLFDKPKLIPSEEAEDGITKVIIGLKKCPLCVGLDHITGEDLEDQEYAKILTALGGATVQSFEDYVGNDYDIVCKETKCFLRGDDKGELTIYFYPRK
ncbi:MAG: hypothetical protein ACTSRB_05355 [Candidatus Helarchaeota archaeon]